MTKLLRDDAEFLIRWKLDNNPEGLTRGYDAYCIKGVRFGFDSSPHRTIFRISVDEVLVYRDGWIKKGAWIGVIEAYLDRIATEYARWQSEEEARIQALSDKYRTITL